METGIEYLEVYKITFNMAMEIFELSKSFPNIERYALTDQIRRSSRSVCACLAEAYRKRRYEAHFISKLTDSDMENTETQIWLKFAKECNYIEEDSFQSLLSKSKQIGRILDHMINHPKKVSEKLVVVILLGII